MKNKTIAAEPAVADEDSSSRTGICENSAAAECFHAAMRILTGKWKGEILYQLTSGTRRFGELRRAIAGITQHMLTTQLRDLEAHGLVKRTVYAEVPPRVDYELTLAGRELRAVFAEIMRWSQSHAIPTGRAGATGLKRKKTAGLAKPSRPTR